jgi:hypothetical protein
MTPLDDQLWEIVRQETSSGNMTIAPVCEGLLRNFIHQGVSRLTLRGAPPQEVNYAEENLRKFVLEMIAEVASSGLTELHENNFLSILKKLCPIFPFC